MTLEVIANNYIPQLICTVMTISSKIFEINKEYFRACLSRAKNPVSELLEIVKKNNFQNRNEKTPDRHDPTYFLLIPKI